MTIVWFDKNRCNYGSFKVINVFHMATLKWHYQHTRTDEHWKRIIGQEKFFNFYNCLVTFYIISLSASLYKKNKKTGTMMKGTNNTGIEFSGLLVELSKSLAKFNNLRPNFAYIEQGDQYYFDTTMTFDETPLFTHRYYWHKLPSSYSALLVKMRSAKITWRDFKKEGWTDQNEYFKSFNFRIKKQFPNIIFYLQIICLFWFSCFGSSSVSFLFDANVQKNMFNVFKCDFN